MAIEYVLERSIGAVAAWIEENDYQGYDPGDGLNSFLRPLAFGNSLLERILLQFVWKAPVNVRPFIGIRPSHSTKGRGYMAAGYWTLHPSHWKVVSIRRRPRVAEVQAAAAVTADRQFRGSSSARRLAGWSAMRRGSRKPLL